MIYFRIFLLFLILTLNSFAQIVLSEIMFNPQGNERYDEFIELYNVSEKQSIDLLGWLVSDGTKFNTILPFEESSLLLPGHYAIILVAKYFQESGQYDEKIPAETLILTIDKSQFGAYGLKNTQGEPISIYSPDTTLVATYQYTPDNSDGYSEEKIDLAAGDVESNWTNAAKSGGSPGYENSVMRHSYDLALTALQVLPEKISTRDSIQLYVHIKNVGKSAVDHCGLTIRDSTHTQSNILTQTELRLGALAPDDSFEIRLALAPPAAGDHMLEVIIDFAPDEQLFNNMARLPYRVFETYPPTSIVINEIMYDTDEKIEEWIEIFNRSQTDINIGYWTLNDKRKRVTLAESRSILKAGSYAILAHAEFQEIEKDHLFLMNVPELNNSGDDLVLRDAVGVVMDSISYNRSYGGGRLISLERILPEASSTDPANWGSCTADSGSTPGQLNSQSPKEYDAELGSLQFLPAQPQAGQDILLRFDILNAGRRAIDEISVTASFRPIAEDIFSHIGDCLFTFQNEININSADILWARIPPGVHVVAAEISMANDMLPENNKLMDTLTVSYKPGSVIINEIMYSPLTGESEWIEIFNSSLTSIELMNWALSDSDTLEDIQLQDSSFIFLPEAFLVIGKDSSVFEKHASARISPKFPSLSNESDHVFLYDGNKRIIDQIAYTSDWGGARGRSLERINPYTASFEPTNWTTCVHPQGHSAGTANSVYIKTVPNEASVAVYPNPFSPNGDGVDDFVGIQYVLPAVLAHVNIKIFDMNGRLVRFLLNNSPSSAGRTVYWDGLDDNGFKCRMGIYIIFLQALNESKMCIECAKKTVVLAGYL